MDSPFIYDKFVTGKNFIGRKSDCTILGNLISQHENIVLYAPPKDGKTSLVQQALFNLRVMGKQLRIGQFSALNIRSVEAFLLRLGGTALRAVATTPSEYAALADRHLGGTHVIFDPGISPIPTRSCPRTGRWTGRTGSPFSGSPTGSRGTAARPSC